MTKLGPEVVHQAETRQKPESPNPERKYDASYRSLDPADISDFVFDQSYAAGDETLLYTKIDVRKPDDQSPVRISADPRHRLDVSLLHWGRNKIPHLVLPRVIQFCGKHAVRHTLHLAVEFPNVLFIWPTKYIADDPDPNSYNLSQIKAKVEATKQWIRMESNKDRQCYDIKVSKLQPPDPAWPDEPFANLLAIAFEGRVIADIDHPIIQRLLTADA